MPNSVTEMHLPSVTYQDPSNLIRLPEGSVRVEDPEEEVFLLYTNLSSRPPLDISSSSSFPGLGSVDSHHDTLTVRFTLPPSPTPIVLEGAALASTSHVSKTKRNIKRTKRALGVHGDTEERVLEIELVQDKTSLRSKRGDTGSVLWRVSVALGQALLNDFFSESSRSLFDPEKLKACDVLELGAGTGLLSLVFAPWVRHYTVTDLDYLVPLVRKNVETNLSIVQQTLKPPRHLSSSTSKQSKRSATGARSEDIPNRITVEPLDWLQLQGASPHIRNTSFRLSHGDPPDLIVLADCVYNPALLPALFATIEHFSAPGQTHVLVAVELRSADVVREFLEMWVASGGWEIWRVGRGDGDGDGWLGVEFAVWVGWKIPSCV